MSNQKINTDNSEKIAKMIKSLLANDGNANSAVKSLSDEPLTQKDIKKILDVFQILPTIHHTIKEINKKLSGNENNKDLIEQLAKYEEERILYCENLQPNFFKIIAANEKLPSDLLTTYINGSLKMIGSENLTKAFGIGFFRALCQNKNSILKKEQVIIFRKNLAYQVKDEKVVFAGMLIKILLQGLDIVTQQSYKNIVLAITELLPTDNAPIIFSEIVFQSLLDVVKKTLSDEKFESIKSNFLNIIIFSQFSPQQTTNLLSFCCDMFNKNEYANFRTDFFMAIYKNSGIQFTENDLELIANIIPKQKNETEENIGSLLRILFNGLINKKIPTDLWKDTVFMIVELLPHFEILKENLIDHVVVDEVDPFSEKLHLFDTNSIKILPYVLTKKGDLIYYSLKSLSEYFNQNQKINEFINVVTENLQSAFIIDILNNLGSLKLTVDNQKLLSKKLLLALTNKSNDIQKAASNVIISLFEKDVFYFELNTDDVWNNFIKIAPTKLNTQSIPTVINISFKLMEIYTEKNFGFQLLEMLCDNEKLAFTAKHMEKTQLLKNTAERLTSPEKIEKFIRAIRANFQKDDEQDIKNRLTVLNVILKKSPSDFTKESVPLVMEMLLTALKCKFLDVKKYVIIAIMQWDPNEELLDINALKTIAEALAEYGLEEFKTLMSEFKKQLESTLLVFYRTVVFNSLKFIAKNLNSERYIALFIQELAFGLKNGSMDEGMLKDFLRELIANENLSSKNKEYLFDTCDEWLKKYFDNSIDEELIKLLKEAQEKLKNKDGKNKEKTIIGNEFDIDNNIDYLTSDMPSEYKKIVDQLYEKQLSLKNVSDIISNIQKSNVNHSEFKKSNFQSIEPSNGLSLLLKIRSKKIKDEFCGIIQFNSQLSEKIITKLITETLKNKNDKNPFIEFKYDFIEALCKNPKVSFNEQQILLLKEHFIPTKTKSILKIFFSESENNIVSVIRVLFENIMLKNSLFPGLQKSMVMAIIKLSSSTNLKNDTDEIAQIMALYEVLKYDMNVIDVLILAREKTEFLNLALKAIIEINLQKSQIKNFIRAIGISLRQENFDISKLNAFDNLIKNKKLYDDSIALSLLMNLVIPLLENKQENIHKTAAEIIFQLIADSRALDVFLNKKTPMTSFILILKILGKNLADQTTKNIFENIATLLASEVEIFCLITYIFMSKENLPLQDILHSLIANKNLNENHLTTIHTEIDQKLTDIRNVENNEDIVPALIENLSELFFYPNLKSDIQEKILVTLKNNLLHFSVSNSDVAIKICYAAEEIFHADLTKEMMGKIMSMLDTLVKNDLSKKTDVAIILLQQFYQKNNLSLESINIICKKINIFYQNKEYSDYKSRIHNIKINFEIRKDEMDNQTKENKIGFFAKISCENKKIKLELSHISNDDKKIYTQLGKKKN